MYDPTADPKKELAYDVRLTIANIVGGLLELMSAARFERKYSDWLNLLDNFHTEIAMKLSDKEEKEFRNKWNATIKIMQQHITVFNGLSQRIEGHDALHNAFKELEIWLKKKADKHDIFGSKRTSEGLS